MIEKIRRDAEAYRQGETPQPVESVGTSVKCSLSPGADTGVSSDAYHTNAPTHGSPVDNMLPQQVDRFVVFKNGYPSDFSISEDPRVLHRFAPLAALVLLCGIERGH